MNKLYKVGIGVIEDGKEYLPQRYITIVAETATEAQSKAAPKLLSTSEKDPDYTSVEFIDSVEIVSRIDIM